MKMNVPGFSAEASVYKMRRGYDYSATTCYNHRGREVVSELRGGAFHRFRGGGGFGTLEDYWICKQACEGAYSACLEGCEGAGSLHCVTCDEDYRACLDGCSRDIA
jgi:hypothetical protein